MLDVVRVDVMSRYILILPALGSGGAQRVFFDVASRLLELGHQVSIVTLRTNDALFNILPNSANYIDLKSRSTLESMWKLRSYLSKQPQSKILSTVIPVNIITIIVSKFLTPSQHYLYVSECSLPSYALYFKKKEKIWMWLMKLVYRFADKHLAVSNAVAKDIAKCANIDSKNIEVIYNPIYDNTLLDKSMCQLRWSDYGVDHNCTKLVTIGRVISMKNIEHQIRSLLYLPDNVILIIVGIGSHQKNLVQLAEDLQVSNRVFFIGFLENPFPVLRNSDVLLMTSQYEGFGNVLIEALSLGVNVVALNTCDTISEVLRNNDAMIVDDVNNPEVFAKKISERIHSPLKKDELVNIAKHYSKDKILEQYMKVLKAE